MAEINPVPSFSVVMNIPRELWESGREFHTWAAEAWLDCLLRDGMGLPFGSPRLTHEVVKYLIELPSEPPDYLHTFRETASSGGWDYVAIRTTGKAFRIVNLLG